MATKKQQIVTHEGKQYAVTKAGLVPVAQIVQSTAQPATAPTRDASFVKGIVCGIALCILAQIVGGYFAQLDPAAVNQVRNIGK